VALLQQTLADAAFYRLSNNQATHCYCPTCEQQK